MKDKGITIMALVITIILLLMLASVSVATLTGENGIITKAIKAREETEKAGIEEQFRLAQLSGTLKKQGEDITVDEWLQEVKEQGVDFTIDHLQMTVKGKYLYEIKWINGEIVYEYQGLVSKPKPRIVSIDIIEYTDSKVIVKVTTERNEEGILKCYIKGENEEYTLMKEQKEGNNTFEISIEPNKIYSQIKIEAIAKNGETASGEEELVNIPSLKENTNITFTYKVNGEEIAQTKWTKGPVMVQATTTEKGYILQYSTDRTTWTNYPTAGIEFTENGALYVRLKDKESEKNGKECKKDIEYIDTIAPVISNVSATVTSSSITLSATVTDTVGEINKCQFSKDNGLTWETTETQTGTSYTFSNLIQGTTYILKMRAIDQAENQVETESISKTTDTIPGGTASIGITYSNTNWTNEPVNVTFTNNSGSSAYHFEYQIDQGGWISTTKTNSITIEVQGKSCVYAKLVDDAGNEGAVATANIVKIDKSAPRVSPRLSIKTPEAYRIELHLQASDQHSGLSKIEWYCSGTKVGDTRYQQMNGAEAGPTTNQEVTKIIENLRPDTRYTIYAKVYDVAGNWIESEVITPTTAHVHTGNATEGGGCYGKRETGLRPCNIQLIQKSDVICATAMVDTGAGVSNPSTNVYIAYRSFSCPDCGNTDSRTAGPYSSGAQAASAVASLPKVIQCENKVPSYECPNHLGFSYRQGGTCTKDVTYTYYSRNCGYP